MKRDNKLKDVLKTFASYGFLVVKNTEHIKLKNERGQVTIVPNHKLVKGSTLSDSIKIAGIDKKEFFARM